ncbi:MAG: hybrid sensor histidine kinase/response regulator [Paracoccus denitrificans]|nr:MAG: hybrid sensor histidine kinase/response regulator [Paracoccus denitrificans]PZO84080.1 MAG: hybrid sensor histidine kinase/response regulator [Paracoccus denitrificans]
MTHRTPLSPRAMAMVPILVLPIVLAAAWLVVAPAAIHPRIIIPLTAFALCWYLIAGFASLSRMSRAYRFHRDAKRAERWLATVKDPCWAVDDEGRVLAQSPAATYHLDILDRSITLLVGRHRALPDSTVASTLTRVTDGGRCLINLDPDTRIEAERHAGYQLQFWTIRPAVEEPDPKVASLHADFATLPVALLRLRADGRIDDANVAALELLGPIEIGTRLAEIVDGPGRPLGDWLTEALGRADTRAEVLHYFGAGIEKFIQVRLTRDGDGLVAVLTDASALKTLEAQFVQSQKMQAIGQLAGGIAHDFNNLLTAISGHCDLLMLRHDQNDPDHADLHQIGENANRAAALVGQLLAFSRKQTLKPQILDVRDTLSDLTHLLNRLVGERTNLVFNHAPALLPIRADKRQLEQVMMNLVVNARDALTEGGEIVVATALLTDIHAHGGADTQMPKGSYVQITVTDQGCGIAPDHLQKIFEPFYTTKRQGEGTGLGLSTAYGIVKQTGGYIFCDSELDHGTCFSLYFPVFAGEIVTPEPAANSALAVIEQVKNAAILLVEDEGPVRAFAARVLRLQGFEVHEAECGETALELLEDQNLQIDLFISDVIMPGMDGPSWVRTALEIRRGTPVIFMSGYTETQMGEDSEPIESAVFLPKPFSLSELVACVENHIVGRTQ